MSMITAALIKNNLSSGGESLVNTSLTKQFVDTTMVYPFYNTKTKTLYARRSGKISKSVDEGKTWKYLIDESVYSPLVATQIFVTENGNVFIWFTDSSTVLILNSSLQEIARHTGMIGPFNTTVGIKEYDGTIMYAEYIGTLGTVAQTIWKSTDSGLTWTATYTDVGIRHWHSVQYDEFGACWWACAGDTDAQLGIYQSLDEGATWTKKAGGKQEYRICGLGFTEKNIMWIPDFPGAYDNNSLHKIARTDINGSWDTAKVIVKSGITGPSYGCLRVNDGRTLFYTAGESTVNSGLYLSDGDQVELIARTVRKFTSAVLLSGFRYATHVDNDNVAYVLVGESDNMDGLYRLKLPLMSKNI